MTGDENGRALEARGTDVAPETTGLTWGEHQTMTIRSVVLGLFFTVLIGAYCFFNDRVIRQEMLINDLMPAVIFGGLIFIVLAVNPLLSRIRKTWVFTRKELAVIMTLALVAGGAASWGLWQFLPSSIMLPHHMVRTKPAWGHEDVLSDVPAHMLPDVSDESTALNGYVLGLSEGTTHLGLADVPWGAWAKPLLFWIPLGLAITLAVVGLAVVFHRQWIHNEQLPYPISRFAHSLMPAEGKMWSALFYDRLFWLGASVVFVIGLSNWFASLWEWWFVSIPLRLDLSSLKQVLPTLERGGGGMLFYPHLIFAVVGLAYFVSNDISLSMAVMPAVFCLIYGWLAMYGISIHGGHHMSIKMESYLYLGGYAGIMAMIIYTGRYYYLSVLRRGIGLTGAEEAAPGAVWGMRVFLGGLALFVLQMVLVGVTWYLALLYALIAVMVWVVVSRAVVETGAMHIGTQIFPGAMLWGLMGTIAIGPQVLMIMFLVTTVLMAGPGWAPMPFAMQSFKLGDMSGVGVSRLGKWALAAVVICTLIAVPATIYYQYDAGGEPTSEGWPAHIASLPFENAVKIKQTLRAQGTTELAHSLNGFSRLSYIRPNGSCVLALLIAFALAIGFAVCRLRFARWPLHPVVFVFLGGHQGKDLAASFLVGGLIKVCIVKYGGNRAYEKLKPLMIGVIAGELFSRFVRVVSGLAYYGIVGTGIE